MNFASLFNLAGPDLIIILLIVLLLFGAKNFPELFRGIGNAVRSFGVAMNRLLVPLAIGIFLLACGVWIWG
ncbi:MAG: twin-arginine translocase TatA/TatE family subunit [Chthoniobacter sp.]|nr:twin-arginine translocase TatA/TatE family subunit [Chthoniobacter sp.]